MARRGAALAEDAGAARSQLLDAAQQCFERYGIVKTTMEDIAKAAGVSRQTVYRYFADRDALVLAVVIRHSYDLIGTAEAHIRRYETFETQLVEGLLHLVDVGRRDPFVRLLVGPEHISLVNHILGESTTVVDMTYELWAPILMAARGRGELRADLDLRSVATWLTHVELILLGRQDLAKDTDALREMLRTFVTPALLAPPFHSSSRRSTVHLANVHGYRRRAAR